MVAPVNPPAAVPSEGRTQVVYAAVSHRQKEIIEQTTARRSMPSISSLLYAIIFRATKGFTDFSILDGECVFAEASND